MIHPFVKCIGIEFLERLHALALEVEKNYNQNISNIFNNNKELFPSLSQQNVLEFVNNDFLKEDWSSASVILANSTCFSNELMAEIGRKAKAECKSGTIIISFTKRVIGLGDEWELKDGFRRVMSWGIATIYVHRKI
ncbi:MAG: hypothetical protein MJ252_13210 [archaeon]|nr:hypothetical protein [archaeon]